jgi:hypothetical protein
MVACQASVEPREPRGQEVTGRVVLVDDTGLAPRPADGGGLLLVPVGSVAALWELGEDGAPEDPRSASIDVSPGAVADLGAVVVTVDGRGHFTVTRTGPHVLCFFHEPITSDTSVVRTAGCSEVDLPAQGKVRATFGEGGFHAEVGR